LFGKIDWSYYESQMACLGWIRAVLDSGSHVSQL
jgi:hypothetical protein